MFSARHLALTATAAVALLAVTARFASSTSAPRTVAVDRSFGQPKAVTISGYHGDAMEPFVTRDGRWLLFNTRNGEGDRTDLMLARRIDDLHYIFVGPLAGANSKALDGVASVDRESRFYFVSNRDFDDSGNTLWSGRFTDGRVSDVRPLRTDFTPKRPLRMNIDLEVSADGSELIVAENRWDLLRRRPSESHLAVSSRAGDRFVRRPESDRLMGAINGDALDYAPATSVDRLTLVFTRWDASKPGDVPHLLIARRSSTADVWGQPRRIEAATGFVEGATFVPGDCGIVYHAKVGEAYRLFLIRRKQC